MAGKEIKQRIVLSGEKEYNQALKDAQRNLKTLQSALKAETAELGRNASEQDKARVKAESLRKQIAEQEKVVKTLQEALAKAREEYGDNEAEIARWEQRLNTARATLSGMKNDLGGVGEGMQQISIDAAAATVATKNVADALGDIGSAGDAVAGAIEGIFQGMIDTVSGAVSELWGMISSTAAKANSWTDVSRFWGTDAQTIQEYARATQAQGKSFEDLQNIVSKLNLGGKGKDIAELIGVSDVNYRNQWDYAMAVMDQMNRMRESGANMDSIYETIFGEKKSVTLMDMLNSWSDIQEDIRKGTYNGNETGYGMSDEELETMDSLWVKINEIETKWQALKENFAAGFGIGTTELLVNVEGTLDGLAGYMNAKDEGEKQAALDQIRTNIEEFFRKVGELIRDSIGILEEVGTDLQSSDDPLTRMIGDILAKVAEGLQWFVDNQEAVRGAFNTIFGVWLLAKLGTVAGALGKILLQIEAIKAFKGINLGGSPTPANPNPVGAPAGADTTAAAAGGGAVSTFATNVLGKAAGVLSSITPFMMNNGAIVYDWFKNNTGVGRAALRGEGDVGEAIQEAFDGVKQNAVEWADTAKGVFNNYAKFWDDFWKPEGMGGGAAKTAADTLEQVLIGNFNNVDTDDILDENGQLTESARKSGLTEADIGTDRNEPAALAVVEPEAGRKNADEARLRQALAAESEANARAAQAEAEARERNRNTADELLRTVTETQREAVEEYYDALRSGEQDEDLWERTGALRALFGDDQNTLDRLMRLAPDRDRATEPKSADALEEAAGSLDEIGRVLGGIVIAETAPEGEIFEEELLDDLADIQREALESLFDSWKEYEKNPTADAENEYDRDYDYARGIFGDDFGSVIERLIQKMDEDPKWTQREDIPESWEVLNSATWNRQQNSGANENGITRQDLAGFNALPGNIRQAVESGAKKGVSGIQVNLDGYRVGQLVAPYVSEMIASEFIM